MCHILLYHQLLLLCSCFGCSAGQVWVGCLTSKNKCSISPQHRANIPHPRLSALNMVRRARWLNVSAFWLISTWLLNSQAVQIEFTDNMCSLEESNRKRTLAQIETPNERENWYLCTYSVKRSCWWTVDYSTSICCLQSCGWLGISESQTSSKTHIHTCMMNTLAIPLLTWNYPTQE